MSAQGARLFAMAASEPAGHPDLIVRPSHFDRLRLDARDDGPRIRRRLETALTWNVFRALELLPPAIWLRRLNARLGLELPAPAASLVRVTLWPDLPLPAAAVVGGARGTAPIDALVETEHAVWAILASHGGDIVRGAQDLTGADPVVLAAQAASERAGRRTVYVALIFNDAREAPVGMSLVERYGRSSAALSMRAEGAGAQTALDNVAGFGAARWAALRVILDECAESDLLNPAERAVAAEAGRWLARVL